jgi:exodeoxyribonuclease V alpha subunit
MAISPERMQELLAKARAAKLAAVATTAQPNPQQTTQLTKLTQTVTTTLDTVAVPTTTQPTGMHGEVISYNTNQQKFIDYATKGDDCVLLGAAGTGKSTCQRGTVQSLILQGKAGIMETGHKYLKSGSPGIVVCAYTRRAVNNIRKVMPADMKDNCISIHKLLEYEPTYYDVIDPVTGNDRKTMKFEPARNRLNPLPSSITTIIFEESSMIATELFAEVTAALAHNVQFIFIGDIQQLPPVFGSAVLGYKMLELPVIELTEVYRQALESPIIRLAHHMLQGKTIPANELASWYVEGKLKLHPWAKKISPDLAMLTMAKFFSQAYDTGAYDPDEDMILIPFNKSFGTDELNRYIAQHIAVKHSRVVHEIVAGFNRYYYAVGDKVMYEKEDCVITEIKINALYSGAKYQEASVLLDRWGNYREDVALNPEESHKLAETSEDDVMFMLDAMALGGDEEEIRREASHELTIQNADGIEYKLHVAGVVNALALGYCLTVHKAQGSEARKVFVLLHESHATMVNRELLYTAVTRARESLYVICPPDTFVKGVQRQRIVGNTLAEKAVYFQGKVDAKTSNQTKLN